MKYEFRAVNNCNMCGGGEFTVLGRRLNGSQGYRTRDKLGFTVSVVRCTECGLVFPNPIPVPETLEQHYGRPPESYWTPNYFKVDEGYFAPQIAQTKRLLKRSDKLRALDIGAGIGKCMIALERTGFQTFGVEPSTPFFQKAIDEMGIAPDRLQNKKMEEAAFEPNFFDFITFGAVLEHLYDPSKSIQIALEWLRPGGVIQLEVPSSNWMVSKLVNLMYRMTGQDYVTNLSPCHPPFHIYEFTLQSFERHAQRLGYEIAHSENHNGHSYTPKPIDRILQPVMRATETGLALKLWLRKPMRGTRN